MERSKDTMTAVLNSINAAIAIVDSKDMRILACNKAFVRESGTDDNRLLNQRP